MSPTARAAIIIAVLVVVRFGGSLLGSGDDPPRPRPQQPAGVVLDQLALAEVRDLAEIVAELRGLTWKYEPEVLFLEPDAFDAAVRPRTNPLAPDEVTPDDYLYRSIGQLAPDATLASVQETFAVDGIDGFYEPSIDTLVVSGSTIDDYTRVVLVHELAHALDAQYYDLGIVRAAATDEALLGARGLVEGSAERVEVAYLDSLSAAERAAYDAALAVRQNEATGFDTLPNVFLAAQSIPYEYGRHFVDALVAEGGEAALERAFLQPPTSSAAMMHPERYLAGVVDDQVDAPDLDGEIQLSGVFGEGRLLGLLAEQAQRFDPIFDWADGWTGDAFVVGTTDTGTTCITITTRLTSPADADELVVGLARWTEAHPDGQVTRIDDRSVGLSTCPSG